MNRECSISVELYNWIFVQLKSCGIISQTEVAGSLHLLKPNYYQSHKYLWIEPIYKQSTHKYMNFVSQFTLWFQYIQRHLVEFWFIRSHKLKNRSLYEKLASLCLIYMIFTLVGPFLIGPFYQFWSFYLRKLELLKISLTQTLFVKQFDTINNPSIHLWMDLFFT